MQLQKPTYSSAFSPFDQYQLSPSVAVPCTSRLFHLFWPILDSSSSHHSQVLPVSNSIFSLSCYFYPSVLPPPPPLTRFPSAPVIFTVNHNPSQARSNVLPGRQQTRTHLKSCQLCPALLCFNLLSTFIQERLYTNNPTLWL